MGGANIGAAHLPVDALARMFYNVPQLVVKQDAPHLRANTHGHGRATHHGVRGRFCFLAYMEIITDTIEIASYYIELPSGGVARVDMVATAGELFITGVLLLLLFVFIWQAVERLANFNSKR